MEKNHVFTFIYSICLLLLSTCFSCSKRSHILHFQHWDRDGDGVMSYDEFLLSIKENKLLKQWDLNGDGTLSEDELFNGFYKLWDSNKNGFIERNEWVNGIAGFFAIYLVSDSGTFDDWDLNNDSKLNEYEFKLAMTKADYFGGWNFRKDNTVSTEEFTEKLFSLWDMDNSGTVEEREFEEILDIYFIED